MNYTYIPTNFTTLDNCKEDLGSLQPYISECCEQVLKGKPGNKALTPSSSKWTPSLKQAARRLTWVSFTTKQRHVEYFGTHRFKTNKQKKMSSFDARRALLEILHKDFQACVSPWSSASSRWKNLVLKTPPSKSRWNPSPREWSDSQKKILKINETVIAETTREDRRRPGSNGESSRLTWNSRRLLLKTSLFILSIIWEVDPDWSWPNVNTSNRKSWWKAPAGSWEEWTSAWTFPKEILERRKAQFPIRKNFIQGGSRAVIAVDKLYVNNQLYHNQNTTPWLY